MWKLSKEFKFRDQWKQRKECVQLTLTGKQLDRKSENKPLCSVLRAERKKQEERGVESQVETTLIVFVLYFRSSVKPLKGVRSDKIKYATLLQAKLFLDSFACKEKGDSMAAC